MRNFIVQLVVVLVATFCGSLSFCAPPSHPSDGQGGVPRGEFGGPGGGRARIVDYSGATEISESTASVDASYSSDAPG